MRTRGEGVPLYGAASGGQPGGVPARTFGLVEGLVGAQQGLPAGLALQLDGGADADGVADRRAASSSRRVM